VGIAYLRQCTIREIQNFTRWIALMLGHGLGAQAHKEFRRYRKQVTNVKNELWTVVVSFTALLQQARKD
jgi:hypothetical protein